ncbi:hypothetical protein J6590_003924 [Homalodisca vitripennis]|nr:hypothetical protein J6590_003924 [Homalodisca vitripennis]
MHLLPVRKRLIAYFVLGHLAKPPEHAASELQPRTPPTQLATTSDTLRVTPAPPASGPQSQTTILLIDSYADVVKSTFPVPISEVQPTCANYQFQRAFKLQKSDSYYRKKSQISSNNFFVCSNAPYPEAKTYTSTRHEAELPHGGTVVSYEHLLSQAAVNFLNRLYNSIKYAPTPKVLKTRLKRILVS